MSEANPVEQEKVGAVPTVDAVLVILVTFVLVLFLGSLFYLVLGSGLALVLSELLILIIPLGYMLIKHVNIKRYVGLDVTPKLVMLGFASGALLLFVDIIVSVALTSIFGVSQAVEESNAIITDLSTSTEGLIAVVAALALAGVCEEFAFRGFLQSTLTRRYSFIPAVFASAFVFGLFHFDIQLVYILSALTAGLVLGYVYYRWNSYVVAAIAHSTVNLVVLVVLLFAG
ncbi:CPBP family intramembrane metalloprotease [Candidatus Bathyarchaeota archaeon]|nr:CPBP family intramembrane metalloprotease [Candidatus Bathyarchaeota archaeon]